MALWAMATKLPEVRTVQIVVMMCAYVFNFTRRAVPMAVWTAATQGCVQ